MALLVGLSGSHLLPRLLRLTGADSWPLRSAVAALVVAATFELVNGWGRSGGVNRWRASAWRLVGFTVGLFGLAVVVSQVQYWWVWVGGLTGAIGLALVGGVMTVFARTVVDDAELVQSARRLCREAGLGHVELRSMPEVAAAGAGGTNGMGATFGRVGRKRVAVIIGDQTSWSRPQLHVVLAHEIAHIKRRHLRTTALLLVVLAILVSAGVDAALHVTAFADLSGVGRGRDPAALPALLAVGRVLVVPAGLIFNACRRWQERVADVDALEFTRDAVAFTDTLKALARDRSWDLDPWWWSRLWDEMPAPAERLALVAWWRGTRVVSFLFTDVVGSTEIIGRVGDLRWFEMIREHNDIVRASVQQFHGREMDNPGDGFSVAFDDAGLAVLCARQIQRRLQEERSGDDDGLHVRMGVHAGEVVIADGSLFGKEVHRAARISAAAGPDEILVSGVVLEILGGTGRFTFGPERTVGLKGFEGDEVVVPVAWEEVGAQRGG